MESSQSVRHTGRPALIHNTSVSLEDFNDLISYREYREFPRMDPKSREDVADMIEEMMEAANKALEPLRMRISKILEEANSGSPEEPRYSQYYVLSPDPAQGDLSRLGSHWSNSYITALSLDESFIVASDILCHKEPARTSKDSKQRSSEKNDPT